MELTSVHAVLVHLAHVQLDSTVLLRVDKAVGGGALARKVEVNDAALLVLHGASRKKSTWNCAGR